MSKHAAAIHHSIRAWIDDLDRDAFAISTDRMDEVVKAGIQQIAARAFLQLETVPTTVTLSPGVYDYTMTRRSKSIHLILVESTGATLSPTSFDDLNQRYKQDTDMANESGTPCCFALFETASTSAPPVHGLAPVVKIRVAPTPTEADELNVYWTAHPDPDTGTYSSSTIVPLSPTLTAALEMACAAQCALLMDPADRARRKISPEVSAMWMSQANSMLREENMRYRFQSGRTQGTVMRGFTTARTGGLPGAGGSGWGFNWGVDWGG